MSQKVRIVNGNGDIDFVPKHVADNKHLMNIYGWRKEDLPTKEESQELSTTEAKVHELELTARRKRNKEQ